MQRLANIIPNEYQQVSPLPASSKTKDSLLQTIGIVLFIMVGLPACQSNDHQYVLSDHQLVKILSDIHASEAMVKNFEIVARDSMAQVYYQQILAIHEVPQKVFETDLKYLNRNPEKLEGIYEAISKHLEDLKTKPRTEIPL